MQVHGLNEDVHVHLLVDGLDKESRLAESFLKERAKNLNDFITRSNKYLEVEQMRVANDPRRDQGRVTPPRDRDYSESRRRDSRRRGSENKSRGGKFDARSKYEKYTALNVPRSQVWKEVSTTEMKRVDRPRLSYRRSGVEQSKYCAFHDGRGHTTDECYELRYAIERFIREGKLQQYLIEHQGKDGKRKPKSRSKSPPRKYKKQDDKQKKPAEDEDQFPKTEFDCSVISGAMGGGGDTISQRRKYLREVLSVRDRPKFKEHHSGPSCSPLYFTTEDLRDVVPGHQDGLVITGILVNCRVKRIFVDAGSSADILSWEAFKRMSLDQEDLKPCKTTLIGFNGEQSRPKGFIDLRFTLGTRDAFRSERVRFIVADFVSPYNIILGRPTIHKWDMLVSTYLPSIKSSR
ncbi:hypothetical protein K1719_039480 [Acacia pycnantha]|nr:hypothetical protein K1719_039480 [Acacia pycnantha]